MFILKGFYKILLIVISQIFKSFVFLRLLAYKSGVLRTKRVKTTVISVGNLTVGGTGKTPVVDLLAKELHRIKKRPVILSRGYKRKENYTQRRLLFCEESKIDPALFGDEPYLLAKRNPNVPVYVGNSRYKIAILAEKRDHPDFFLLDDAYQHIAIHRDLNLLLIDAEQFLGNGHLIPFGILREPKNQLKRADAIIITKSNLAKSNSIVEKLKDELQIDCPIFNFKYEIQKIRRIDGKGELKLNEISNKRLLLTSGIAQPKGFEKLIGQYKFEIAGKIEFPDHHDYKAEDVRKILNEYKKLESAFIFTTEKDAVKLNNFPEIRNKIWVLEMEMIPDNSWKVFFHNFCISIR